MPNGTPEPLTVGIEQCDFIFLLKYTAKGIASIRESPTRVEQTNEFVRGKLKTFCAFTSTSGKYDMVSFFNGTDQQAYEFQLWLRSLGTLEVDMLKTHAKSMGAYNSMLRALF
jgi:uncharacterized protein with GYD domain